jgi:hypothetical protein
MEYRKKSGEEPRLRGGFRPHVCELPDFPVKNFRAGSSSWEVLSTCCGVKRWLEVLDQKLEVR